MRNFKPIFAFACGITLFFSACQKEKIDETTLPKTNSAPLLKSANANNWMGSLNSSLKLSQISIPGSHDAGALHEPVAATAKCQNLDIAEQLRIGVRFLDIRCRHINNAFAIHHGSIYQQMNFDDVLNASIGFLNSNPSECIIMCVKEEYDATGNNRSFEQTFDSYVAKDPAKWYLGTSIPALEQVRGKIVLMRRFGAGSPKGIDASVWPDNTTFNTGCLRVQDYYQVSNNNTKWNNMVTLFNEANSGNDGTLFLNFTSGVKDVFLGIPSITAVSKDINPWFVDYLKNHQRGRLGIIAMDFSDSERTSYIINTNSSDDNIMGITFYEDVNYGGAKSQVLGKGDYTLAQLQAKGVLNDWASSCKIPYGWKIVIYQHDNFGGTSWTLYPDAAFGQAYFTGYSGLNDAMSSVRIQ